MVFMIETFSLMTGERHHTPVTLPDVPAHIGDDPFTVDGPDNNPYPGYHDGPYPVTGDEPIYDGDPPF